MGYGILDYKSVRLYVIWDLNLNLKPTSPRFYFSYVYTTYNTYNKRYTSNPITQTMVLHTHKYT